MAKHTTAKPRTGKPEELERTNDIFSVFAKRRSIRRYKPFDIPDEDLEKILDAARLAPSANNTQPWRFILVKDEKVKALLAQPRPQTFIADANAIIVVLGDPSVWGPRGGMTWTTRDPIIATENLVLAATALGYGSCWIAMFQSRRKEYLLEVKRTLGIPEEVQLICLVAIGVPDEQPSPRARRALEEIAYSETYGTPWKPKP